MCALYGMQLLILRLQMQEYCKVQQCQSEEDTLHIGDTLSCLIIMSQLLPRGLVRAYHMSTIILCYYAFKVYIISSSVVITIASLSLVIKLCARYYHSNNMGGHMDE